MKINPVAIQAYQQLTRQERPAPQDNRTTVNHDSTSLTIEPQQPQESSTLAVRANAENYSKFLSGDEKEAVEMLFSRFRDAGRFGPGYAADAASTPLGQVVDIKV